MAHGKLTRTQYRQLADFRHTLRRFLRFSEAAAEQLGLSGQQYEALLALRAALAAQDRTIGYVARRLLIKHNSAGELVERLVKQKLVRRQGSALDRREVELSLSPKGERLIQRLADVHRRELRGVAVRLAAFTAHGTSFRGSR